MKVERVCFYILNLNFKFFSNILFEFETGDDAHWPIPGVFGSQSEANLRTMQHDGYRFGKSNSISSRMA